MSKVFWGSIKKPGVCLACGLSAVGLAAFGGDQSYLAGWMVACAVFYCAMAD